MKNYLSKSLFLLFLLTTKISATGSDKEGDSPKVAGKKAAAAATSQKGLLQGKSSTMTWHEGTDKKGVASQLLKGLLNDQLHVASPELSKNYVFFLSEPGNLMENICNGGSHVAFVTAVWRAEPPKSNNRAGPQWQTFEAVKHELGVERYNRAVGFQKAKYEDPDFNDSAAVESLKGGFHWVALGKSGLKKTFRELISMLDTESENYFNTGKNQQYDYYRRNCRHYVESVLTKLEVEHHLMGDIVLSPQKRSAVAFDA